MCSAQSPTPLGTLHVTVKAARHLRCLDAGTAPDPQVRITLDSLRPTGPAKTKKTTCKRGTCDPTWEETLTFTLFGNMSDILQIEVIAQNSRNGTAAGAAAEPLVHGVNVISALISNTQVTRSRKVLGSVKPISVAQLMRSDATLEKWFKLYNASTQTTTRSSRTSRDSSPVTPQSSISMSPVTSLPSSMSCDSLDRAHGSNSAHSLPMFRRGEGRRNSEPSTPPVFKRRSPTGKRMVNGVMSLLSGSGRAKLDRRTLPVALDSAQHAHPAQLVEEDEYIYAGEVLLSFRFESSEGAVQETLTHRREVKMQRPGSVSYKTFVNISSHALRDLERVNDMFCAWTRDTEGLVDIISVSTFSDNFGDTQRAVYLTVYYRVR